MSDYTPTTEEMRAAYVTWNSFPVKEQTRAEFHRWLAEVKAEAWEEGHSSKWVDKWVGKYSYGNPYRGENK